MKNFTIASVILNILLLVAVSVLLYQFLSIPKNTQVENPDTNIPDENTTDQPLDLNEIKFKIDQFAIGLDTPWDMEFVDSNTILVSERPGRIRLIKNNKLVEAPLFVIPDVREDGEAGLLGLAIDPDFANNKFVYAFYDYRLTHPNILFTKLVRFTFENDKLANFTEIIKDIPAGRGHSGGQIEFGPDSKLYISTGEGGEPDEAQNLKTLAGKILRINRDGTAPEDNPFINSTDGTNKMIWSYGHRNPQGIDWHPETKNLYSCEHGQVGMDEINLIEPGMNYGWPVIQGRQVKQGMVTPLMYFSPSIAPGSIVFYNGNMFPELKNYLLITGLVGQTLTVVDVNADTNEKDLDLVGPIIDESYGRIRNVSIGPDGAIYFTTSNLDGRGEPREGDDKIFKITRSNEQ